MKTRETRIKNDKHRKYLQNLKHIHYHHHKLKHHFQILKQKHIENRHYKQYLLHYCQKQQEQRRASRKTIWGKIKWIGKCIRDTINFGLICGLVLGSLILVIFLLNDINIPEIIISCLVFFIILYLWKHLK